MKRIYFFIGIFLVLFSGCEDIYTPDVENQEPVLIIDARIVYGENNNFVEIHKSLGFNEAGTNYPEVTGATVKLIDNENLEYVLPEYEDGKYRVNFTLDNSKSYRLKINYGSDVYESEFESVPEIPVLDTVYGFAEEKIIVVGAQNDVNDFLERPGVMLYTDLKNEETKYYRFTARKTFEYVYYIPDPVMGELNVHAWKTVYPNESFNIAAPAEYSSSNNIIKHPLYFMTQKTGVMRREPFVGWILFLHQYAISKNAYNFYKDVNNQLDAEGRLFDPVYVQAKNNLTCTTNPEKLVLGNFEISTHRESRFFVTFLSEQKGYMIKPIPYFYDIPLEGESIEVEPDFWETPSKKTYPNE